MEKENIVVVTPSCDTTEDTRIPIELSRLLAAVADEFEQLNIPETM